MKQNILILVNSFISCSKKQYFKTQLINTEHRTQNTDTEHRTQTHVKNIHTFVEFYSLNVYKVGRSDRMKFRPKTLKVPRVPFAFETECERLNGNSATKQLPNYHLSDFNKVSQMQFGHSTNLSKPAKW